jgi:hypothetical protein
MMNIMQKITCPFCFISFPPERMLFRCNNPGCSGQENDTIYAEKRQQPVTKMGHLFEVRRDTQERSIISSFLRSIPRSAPCDVCFVQSHTHICPECHFELSHDVGQVKQRIIAIIGGTGTGKSHYIGSLIYVLKVERRHNLIVTLLEDSTQQRWMRDFYSPVFERRTVLPGTLPASQNPDVKTPLVVRLHSKEHISTRVLRGHFDQAINVSIFDAAGEDMADYRKLSRENQAIVHADALIFMIDPLQIESVRQQLPWASTISVDPATHPDNMLGRLITLFEEQGNVKPGSGKIHVPTAFLLSKVDVLESLVYKGSSFLRPTTHMGELQLAEVQSVSTDVLANLRQWQLSGFCDLIDQRFQTYSYFGASALGRQPDAQGTFAVVEPLRVEEPFLWLLCKLGFVPGR